MLSSGVVESHATINTASDQDVTVWRVLDRLDRLVELSEVATDASLLDVEHAHRA